MGRTLGKGLSEFDYLVRSDDVTRQGALRFLDERKEPLSQMTDPVPRRLDIEEIRAIAARYERDPLGAAEEARILAGAGGSLGGARPKANVIDGDQLWIAKFTAVGDTWPVERAEVAILNLGRALGLNTAVAELALPRSEAPVALIRRFDRRGQGRIPYISARTALQMQGAMPGYYTDIADVIREISVDALADLRELWRRMVFSILVNNTDDHLKNHGFLYVRDNRWRLAPAFDVNAQARRQPQMETGISPLSGFEPSVDAAVGAAPFFEIQVDEARQLARDLADGISKQWRAQFQNQGVRGAAASAYTASFCTSRASASPIAPDRWKQEDDITRKHGGLIRRVWRKIHLGIDEDTLEIRAVEVTSSNVGDVESDKYMPMVSPPVPETGGMGSSEPARDAAGPACPDPGGRGDRHRRRCL